MKKNERKRMKFNLDEISKIQKSLDDYINKKNNVTSDDIFKRKQIAFLVELGEFTNEVRSFKWWSKRSASSKDILLEEYVDGLHFIISLGLDMKNKNWKYNVKKHDDTNSTVLKTYKSMMDFEKNPKLKSWNVVMNSFLDIATTMDFKPDEIYDFYRKKNKINIERQKQDY